MNPAPKVADVAGMVEELAGAPDDAGILHIDRTLLGPGS